MFRLLILAFSVTLGTQAGSQQADAFLNKAAETGMNVVVIGRVAIDKGSTPEVRTLARRVVTDHWLANQELVALAEKLRVTLAIDPRSAMRPDKPSTTTPLANLEGAELDRAFVDRMVKDHEQAIALYEPQAKDSENEDVKSWAARQLEKLESHLELARELQGKDPGQRPSH